MRGVTAHDRSSFTVDEVSIHTPHAGCDSRKAYDPMYPSPFQSTHPMRGVTVDIEGGVTMKKVSIHTPHAGCDNINENINSGIIMFQSTHPMRGVTDLSQATHPDDKSFNPHTPCGV